MSLEHDFAGHKLGGWTMEYMLTEKASCGRQRTLQTAPS